MSFSIKKDVLLKKTNEKILYLNFALKKNYFSVFIFHPGSLVIILLLCAAPVDFVAPSDAHY